MTPVKRKTVQKREELHLGQKSVRFIRIVLKLDGRSVDFELCHFQGWSSLFIPIFGEKCGPWQFWGDKRNNFLGL